MFCIKSFCWLKIIAFFFIITQFFLCQNVYTQENLQGEFINEVGDEEFEKILRGLVRDTFFDIINDPIFGERLLRSPFYFHTKPIFRRQLLDNELFQYFDLSEKHKDCVLNIMPFYVQTGKICYTENKKGIESYIDIHQPGLIQTLDDLQFTQTIVPDFLALFSELKIQERKLGCMFEYSGIINKSWIYKLQLPVLYQQYNYYLTGKERADLIDFFINNEQIAIAAPSTEGSGSGGSSGIIKFIRRHLVSDKIGCSDLKIVFESVLNQTDVQTFISGMHLIVPIAFPFKQGLLGNRFDTSKKRPLFNLHTDLIDLYLDGHFNQLKTNALNLGVEIFDRISTILLEQQLGNRRHFGVGSFMKVQVNFANKISLFTKIQAEILMPMTEKRFVKKQLDTPDFNAAVQDNPVTQQQARIDVDILTNTFLDKMFPERYPILVMPGLKLEMTSLISKKGNRWKGSLGSDCWFQAQEYLFPSVALQDLSIFDLIKARQSFAFQHKVLFQIEPLYSENSTDWRFKIQISGTTFSYGIGKEFSCGVNFVKLF